MEPQDSRSVIDLDADVLVQCASKLSLQDIANMAMSCKFLCHVAYSDSIWRRLYRERWPQQYASLDSSKLSGVRGAYLSRNIDLQQFKFADPFTHMSTFPTHSSHILFDKLDIIFAQGSTVQILKLDTSSDGGFSFKTQGDHNGRITCMRQFPLKDISLFRSEAQNDDNVLVTSSNDRTIRLWWKGRSHRCFRGHYGRVCTLADKLVDESNGKVLASGGEDGTVRLWSLSSPGKRGQHALRATLYGHDKPVTFLTVAGYNSSRLVSISKDAKVRIWDTNAPSTTRSSQCVGVASVTGDPIAMKCHDMLCYVAAGSSVVAIDFRTMKKVSTVAVNHPKIYSLEILPSKSLICTGGNKKAMLWDIRKNQGTSQPVVDLESHAGPVSHLHMDPYKIVTGGPEDAFINIWETDTGVRTNSLTCNLLDEMEPGGGGRGLGAMAVNGCRIVTSSCGDERHEPGLTFYRDFSQCQIPLSSQVYYQPSKFWEQQFYPDD